MRFVAFAYSTFASNKSVYPPTESLVPRPEKERGSERERERARERASGRKKKRVRQREREQVVARQVVCEA